MLTRWGSLVRTQYRAPPLFAPQKDSGNFVGADGIVANRKGKLPSFRIANRLRPLFAGLVN